MTDTFTLLGTTFNNVAGFLATDSDGVVQTFEQESASPWTHLAHEEYEISTTSTSWTTIGTINLDYRAYNSAQFLYVRVRDKAGVRQGYYAGSDTLISNYTAYARSSTAARWAPSYYYGGTTSSNPLTVNAALAASTYGIIPYTLSRVTSNLSASGINVILYARYNSSYSKTIDSTYSVDIFLLSPPEGYPTIFNGSYDGSYMINNLVPSYVSVDKTSALPGEIVTITTLGVVESYDVDLYANIGSAYEHVIILENPTVRDQTATFIMPNWSVNIIAALRE